MAKPQRTKVFIAKFVPVWMMKIETMQQCRWLSTIVCMASISITLSLCAAITPIFPSLSLHLPRPFFSLLHSNSIVCICHHFNGLWTTTHIQWTEHFPKNLQQYPTISMCISGPLKQSHIVHNSSQNGIILINGKSRHITHFIQENYIILMKCLTWLTLNDKMHSSHPIENFQFKSERIAFGIWTFTQKNIQIFFDFCELKSILMHSSFFNRNSKNGLFCPIMLPSPLNIDEKWTKLILSTKNSHLFRITIN